MPGGESGLGPQLAGEKITVNTRTVSVVKQLGEGGFSFVYLVKDQSDPNAVGSAASEGSGASRSGGTPQQQSNQPTFMVLKITSIHSRQQRDVAEKEAKLLSRLSHPSIVRMIDACYRTTPVQQGRGGGITGGAQAGGRPQHLILMEYCEGGTALSVCNTLRQNNQRFDLPSLIIAFGQICNAVSYLHAQRPPIVHRDLKPVNFLVKNGAYKLCDFGSAVFGHVDLRTPRARSEAEEVIQKTTTQMFRAPEMVDLWLAKKLTQATDVWALGCCLYSLAFFQNCFEEGSNLAILSRNYKIPDDNPYGEGIVELIDRMLTVDVKARADMTEVILCLSAIYSGRPLPPRKQVKVKKPIEGEGEVDEKKDRVGKFRTDGQGILAQEPVVEPKKNMEAKKLNPDSAAARRRRAAKRSGDSPTHSAPDSDPAPLTSELGAQHHTAGAASKPAAVKMKDFETSFSDLFALKGNPAADPFRRNGKAGKGGNENDPLSFSNMGTTNDVKDEFPAFGGEGGAAFAEANPFPAFDGSAASQRDEQPMAGEYDEGLGKAKQEVNAGSKERRNRSDQQAKLSEPPHPSGDDSPAGKGKKRGSGIKGLFKKGAKDEP